MPRYALTAAGIRRSLDAVAARDPAIEGAVLRLGYPAPRRRSEGFGTLLQIIVSQQVSTAAAASIYGRLAEAMGDVDDPEALDRLRARRLRRAGLSTAKITYARALARAIDHGDLDLRGLRALDDAAAAAQLTAVKGIGPWSAQIYLMFALGRPDLWPSGDLAVREGLGQVLRLDERPTPAQTKRLTAEYSPHRSAVALLCWSSVHASRA